MQVVVRSARIPVVRGPETSVYGATVKYLEAGDGDPVVLIHGSGVGGSGQIAWRPAAEILAQDFRVIAPDMLWSGWSDIPDMPYSLEAQANQLVGLLETLDIDRCAVVGQSMGAYIAARFACDYPDRVSHLCLVASNTVSKSMGLDLPDTPGLRAKDGVKGTRETTRAVLETVYFRKELINEAEIDRWTAIAQRPGMDQARASMTEYVQALDANPNRAQSFSLRGRLDQLTIPMILIWGRQDTFASIELAAQLRPLLPLQAYHEVESASHAVFRDQPEAFSALVRDFLKSS